MKTALFPGSFDPFTLGHLDVLESALRLFDEVVVAVGCNSSKHGFFPPDVRLRIIEDSIAPLRAAGHRIRVCTYNGLTVSFCREQQIPNIVRGLRTTTDFELESVIAQANRRMDPSVSTCFIPASQEYSYISSTVVRDVILNGGDASLFMAPGIDLKQYL